MTHVRITSTGESTSVTVNGQTVEVDWVHVSSGHFHSGRCVCTVAVSAPEQPPGDGWRRPRVGTRWWDIRPTRLEISAVTEPQ